MSEAEVFELSDYSYLLDYHSDFLEAAKYMTLYQKYFQGKITLDKFYESISNMISLNQRESTRLEKTRNLLTSHSKSLDFF